MRKINTRSFQLATRSTTRQVNRQIVLNLVREHQPISRAELARRMAVARGSVTPLVKALLADGLIYEGATGDTSRGRKPKLLFIRTGDRLAIGIDVRYSRTSLMLTDFAGDEIALETLDTPASAQALVAELVARVKALVREHAEVGECEGVGLVVPGMVDRSTGVVLNAPALDWHDVDVRGELAAAVDLPVHIDRDAVACAMAHMWLSQAGSDAGDNFAYITVSDGVGTGLVMNGTVLRGFWSTAGEFGHLPVSLDGPVCACGSRGCLEAYASNPATVARYLGRELASREVYAQLRACGVGIRDVIERARAGDAAANWALWETGRYLGIGVANVVNAVSPARVVMGGDITAAWDLIEPAIQDTFQRRALTAASAATPLVVEHGEDLLRLKGGSALVLAPVLVAPEVA